MKEKIEKRLENLKMQLHFTRNHCEDGSLIRGIEILEVILDALNYKG